MLVTQLVNSIQTLTYPALSAYYSGIEIASIKGDKQAAKEMAVFAKRIDKQLA